MVRVQQKARGRTTGTSRNSRRIQSVVATLLDLEVAMTIRRKRSTRAALGSLGRPSVAGRAEQGLFWRAIARGLSIEGAALKAGVSEVIGSRLFRKAGGMPPSKFRPS